MERKIGEIFEYGVEWYQCIIGNVCKNCAFNEMKCYTIVDNGNPIGNCCANRRKDNKDVIFKKLEKVGEPFTCNLHGDERLVWMQEYKLYDVNFCKGNALLMYVSDYKHKRIAIEIKQTKEDMEQEIEYFNREQHTTEDYPTKEEKIAERIANKVSENIQNQLEKNMNKLKLKPFSLELAKQGKPVCTRDGRKARIICFDRKDNTPIVALIECVNHAEILQCVHNDGKCFHYDTSNNDLMMLPEKKEGWVNVYKDSVYDTKDEALMGRSESRGYIDTIKVRWEE